MEWKEVHLLPAGKWWKEVPAPSAGKPAEWKEVHVLPAGEQVEWKEYWSSWMEKK